MCLNWGFRKLECNCDPALDKYVATATHDEGAVVRRKDARAYGRTSEPHLGVGGHARGLARPEAVRANRINRDRTRTKARANAKESSGSDT